MSTYYDIVCVEHGEPAGFHWNHGDEQLKAIADALPTLVGVDPGVFDNCLGVRWFAETGPSINDLVAYAKRHEGCTLKPKNEYGQWYDQCDKRIECSGCGKYDDCVLDTGHALPCSKSAQRVTGERT